MTARARWIALGVALVLVLGLGALYWFNTNLMDVEMSEVDGQRTWDILSGERATFSADEVRPGDRYTCSDLGHRPVAAPLRGHRIASPVVKGVVSVATAEDGDVTVTCERGVALPADA